MGTGQAYRHQESLIQMKRTQEGIEPSVARAPSSFALKGISLAPGPGSLPSLRKSVPRTERLLKREGGRERQKKEHRVRCPVDVRVLLGGAEAVGTGGWVPLLLSLSAFPQAAKHRASGDHGKLAVSEEGGR